MAESLESARRWSGYVCPDCRFVFRVPRDHDGRGIVCPSCRRMLRIPTASDLTPPLMAEVKPAVAEAPEPAEGERVLKKRRRGRRSGGTESHSWETRSERSSHRGEGGQKRLLVVAGALVLLLAVAGVVISRNRAPAPVAKAPGPVAVAPAPAVEPPKPSPAAGRDVAALLGKAEPLARKFLGARTVEEILPLVRDAAAMEPKMRAFYQESGIEAPGFSAMDSGDAALAGDKVFSVSVTTGWQEQRVMAFVETPDGLKVDWESWTGWSEMPWEEFRSTKPAEGKLFRVILSPVEYYNFGFSDESKWQSFRLLSPNREDSLYGYAPKGSVLESRLKPQGDEKQVFLTLSLKFPAGASSDSQVEIERVMADGWVVEEGKR